MNLVDDMNKLYISALKPSDREGKVRVSGLAEFAGWKVRQRWRSSALILPFDA